MRRIIRRKDKVWREFEKDKGHSGIVKRVIYDSGDKEVLCDFYENGTAIFSREDCESWHWTDNYGGTWLIRKGRDV